MNQLNTILTTNLLTNLIILRLRGLEASNRSLTTFGNKCLMYAFFGPFRHLAGKKSPNNPIF